MQLTPVTFRVASLANTTETELDPTDLTTELAGARQALDDAVAFLDELRGVSDAAEGARLAGEVDSLLSWADSQLDDAVMFADGFDEDIVANVEAASELATKAATDWSAVDATQPGAIQSAIDGVSALAEGASAHAGSALDHFGV